VRACARLCVCVCVCAFAVHVHIYHVHTCTHKCVGVSGVRVLHTLNSNIHAKNQRYKHEYNDVKHVYTCMNIDVLNPLALVSRQLNNMTSISLVEKLHEKQALISSSVCVVASNSKP